MFIAVWLDMIAKKCNIDEFAFLETQISVFNADLMQKSLNCKSLGHTPLHYALCNTYYDHLEGQGGSLRGTHFQQMLTSCKNKTILQNNRNYFFVDA